MIKVVSLSGKAYFLAVGTETTERVSGNGELRFTITENKSNKEVLKAVSKKWKVKNVGGDEDYLEYTINVIHRDSNGFKQKVSIIARESHIEDMKSQRIYDNYTGSFTAYEYFTIVFRGSGYNFRLVKKLYALRWENAGDGATRIEMLKNALNRYNSEYVYDPVTKTFIITPYVSNVVSNYYISSEVNANNISIEEDSTEFFTYIRGYGDFEDNSKFQNAKLKLEYTHPLANIIGKIHAPIIADGRIKDENLLRTKMENYIDDSLKVSISLDFIEIKTKRNAHNNIINQDVVLGDYKRHQRYQAAVSNATSFVGGISGGSKSILTMKEKLENTIKTTNNVIEMAQSLNASIDGLKSVNGLSIVAFMALNGIKYSNDGGKTFTTAITGDGINPDAIPIATEIQNGIMSKEDKQKLNRITGTAPSNTLGSVFYKEVIESDNY